MNIIVCVDDRWGMAFNGRRVSSDKRVTERITALADGGKLRMNSYSAKIFDETTDVFISDEFLSEAEVGDFCFVENVDISEYLNSAKEVIVYRWNRRYPSDLKFPEEELFSKMKLVSTVEFEGNSHDKITEARYSLC